MYKRASRSDTRVNMRKRAQIVRDIQKLARVDPNDRNCAKFIHSAIHGYECDLLENERRGTIPWNLIKVILCHSDIKTHLQPSGMQIFNAEITPNIIGAEQGVPAYDFSFCESTVPLLFTNCLLDGELRFDYSIFKSLWVVKSTIQAVNLRGARIKGALTFDRCFFNRTGDLSIKARGVKVRGTLSIRQCVAVGGIRLLGARIGGDLNATGAFLISTRYGGYVWGIGKTLSPIWDECLHKFYPHVDPKLTAGQSIEAMRDALWEAMRDARHKTSL